MLIKINPFTPRNYMTKKMPFSLLYISLCVPLENALLDQLQDNIPWVVHLEKLHLNQRINGLLILIQIYLRTPHFLQILKIPVWRGIEFCSNNLLHLTSSILLHQGAMLCKNTSIESCDSGIAGELPPRLEALARASKQSSLSRGKF